MNRRHQVQGRRPGFNPPPAAGGGVPPLALKRAPRAATRRSAAPDALARHRAHARPRGRETSPPPPATPRLCLGAPRGDGERRRSGDGVVGRRELGFLPPAAPERGGEDSTPRCVLILLQQVFASLE
jgi:hypothetical protein